MHDMHEHWKRLDRKQILDHKRIKVYEDMVELPDGQVTDYVHFGEARGAVCIIPINERREVLLQREYSYPLREWLLQFPGGAMEGSETPPQAAARELGEEAQLRAAKLTKVGQYFIDNRRIRGQFHVFTAEELSPCNDYTADITEVFENHWTPMGAVDALIREGQLANHAALAAWAIFKAQQSPGE